MTRKRFKRLFIVLLGPLLIAGAIFAGTTVDGYGSLRLRCEIGLSGNQYCRATGWDDFDEMVAKEAPAWFDVHTRPLDKNTFPSVYVSASQRLIDEVEIINVSPYWGTADGPGSPTSELQSRASQKISIIFGVGEERRRDFDLLGCNELDFEKAASGIFAARLCGIPDGLVRVDFRVGQKGQQDLMALKSAIDNEVAIERQRIIETYLFLTPIFVVLFLLVSGVIWLIRRAATYVLAA